MSRCGNVPCTLVLAQAIAIGSWIVASPCAVAEEPAQQPAPTVQVQQSQEPVQAQQPSTAPAQAQQPSAESAKTSQASAALQPQQPAKVVQAQSCVGSERLRVTGSNITRPRTDCNLPLVTLDRGYIDQSGANTASELLRTVPQIQTSPR